MPEFLAPLENLTVTQGRDVQFTCIVNDLGSFRVSNFILFNKITYRIIYEALYSFSSLNFRIFIAFVIITVSKLTRKLFFISTQNCVFFFIAHICKLQFKIISTMEST